VSTKRFEKSDSKNCELVPTCPACYDCKCKNFLNRKITASFKLNLKADGSDFKNLSEEKPPAKLVE
jgi:hypothetical protein